MAVAVLLPIYLAQNLASAATPDAYLDENFVRRTLAVDLGQELGELDRRNRAGDADK